MVPWGNSRAAANSGTCTRAGGACKQMYEGGDAATADVASRTCPGLPRRLPAALVQRAGKHLLDVAGHIGYAMAGLHMFWKQRSGSITLARLT